MPSRAGGAIPGTTEYSDEPEGLRMWVGIAAQGLQDSGDRDKGVHLKWTITRRSAKTAEQVEAAWARVKDKPDHPDRAVVEAQRKLLAAAEIRTVEVYFAWGASWWCEERWPNSVWRAGSSSSERWMTTERESGAGITIIGMGIPFPAGRNPASFLDTIRQGVGIWIYNGVPNYFPDVPAERIEGSEADWTVVLPSRGLPHKVVVKGSKIAGESGGYLAARIGLEYPETKGKEPEWVIRLADHKRVEGFEALLPSRAVRQVGDMFIETWAIESIEVVNLSEIIDRAAVPDPASLKVPSGQSPAVADYRTHDSPAWEGYETSPRGVWYRSHDADRYDKQPPLRAPDVVPGSVKSRGAGSTPVSLFWGVGVAIAALTIAIGAFKYRKGA